MRVLIAAALWTAGCGTAGDGDTASLWPEEGDAAPQVPDEFVDGMAALTEELQGVMGELAAARDEIASLRAGLAAIESQYEAVDTLMDYVYVDPDGHDVFFIGANVHVRSGSGRTDDGGNPVGLGNLIVGYDEVGEDDAKTGSHNLILGPHHSYMSTAGLVAGYDNEVSGFGAAVCGGLGNAALGDFSSVGGGMSNTAMGAFTSVGGGTLNTAAGDYSAILGGQSNVARGARAAVVGGFANVASGESSVVVGGDSNVAAGECAAVPGGQDVRQTASHPCAD